jgi:FMN phosphatase YigB (HAD superfamily)
MCAISGGTETGTPRLLSERWRGAKRQAATSHLSARLLQHAGRYPARRSTEVNHWSQAIASASVSESRNTLRAVVLDVDGTLYRQWPVRLRMMAGLLRHLAANPREGGKVLRVLRAYRLAQERLRLCGETGMASRQIEMAAELTGYQLAWVRSTVKTWMEERPLEYVRRARQPGVLEFCDWANQRGIALAALSDYDPRAKLAVLSLDRRVPVAACAQDPDINVFKPHPAGMSKVLDRIGVSRKNAIYVGDRPEVDGALAIAAGVQGYILGTSKHVPAGLTAVRDWSTLQAELTSQINWKLPCLLP